MKRIIITFILLLIADLVLIAQVRDIVYREITDKSDLDPYFSNRILYQDRLGFIWIGSFNGLQRYDGYEFKDYTEMISPKWLYSITEDKRGILWIGSSTGIHLLNPENDQAVQFLPSDSTDIYKVYEDGHGIMWCASMPEGLIRLEQKSDDNDLLKKTIFDHGVDSAFQISVFKYDENSAINIINDIFEDSYGNFWVGCEKGLFVFNRETNVFFQVDGDGAGNTRLSDQDVLQLAEEAPGILWVRSQNGLTRISGVDKELPATGEEELNYTKYSNPFSESTFLITRNKNLLIGTYADGLIRMNINRDLSTSIEGLYPDVNDPAYLFGTVRSLMEDRTGLLWAGHEYNGIKTFRVKSNPFVRQEGRLKDYPGLKYNFNQIYQDNNNDIWLCTWGSGVFRLCSDGRIDHFHITDQSNPDANADFIWMIIEIDDGIFLVSTGDGIYQFNSLTGRSQKLWDLLVSRMIRKDHYILFRMDEANGLFVLDLNTFDVRRFTASPSDIAGLKSNNIFSINELQSGEIWVTTFDPPGLTRLNLNSATGEMEFLPLPQSVAANESAILDHALYVFQVYEDSKGNLWFCTYNGLVRIDPVSGEMMRWTKENGLADNWVEYVVEDSNAHLWIVSQTGLSMLDTEAGTIKTYGASDGLPDIIPSFTVPLQTKEGQIYIGGIGGFYSFHPDSLIFNHIVPSVVVTDFMLFKKRVEVDSTKKAILSKDISYTRNIELKYNQHDISFTFAALDYNDPSRNRYKYKLEGYDDEWIETGADNRTASYTNLSPDNYVFRVIASNNDGIWNEEGTYIEIVIHPPIWKTIWAYIAYGIIILALLRGYIYWRMKLLRKEKMMLEKEVSERTKEIEKQKDELGVAVNRLREHEVELQEANVRLQEHQDELEAMNTRLAHQKNELHEVNTLLEDQKKELIQQKEELQTTLESLQKTQDQLVESEKMAAVGGLVAGVAHELNTPVGIGITAISNLIFDVQRMADLFKNDEISREDFTEFLESSFETAQLIQKNLERTAALIQSFKQVSTDQVTEQQRIFAFKDYLDDILSSLRPKFRGKKIDFAIDCHDELKLNSYPGVFAQIFTTLLLNSLQFGFFEKDQGKIKITVRTDQDNLKIQYTDDGAGIKGKDLPHIFEPFYTSDQHRGTGLGLNIIYNLIRQKLHGSITCQSEPGKGVLFTIEMPMK